MHSATLHSGRPRVRLGAVARAAARRERGARGGGAGPDGDMVATRFQLCSGPASALWRVPVQAVGPRRTTDTRPALPRWLVRPPWGARGGDPGCVSARRASSEKARDRFSARVCHTFPQKKVARDRALPDAPLCRHGRRKVGDAEATCARHAGLRWMPHRAWHRRPPRACDQRCVRGAGGARPSAKGPGTRSHAPSPLPKGLVGLWADQDDDVCVPRHQAVDVQRRLALLEDNKHDVVSQVPLALQLPHPRARAAPAAVPLGQPWVSHACREAYLCHGRAPARPRARPTSVEACAATASQHGKGPRIPASGCAGHASRSSRLPFRDRRRQGVGRAGAATSPWASAWMPGLTGGGRGATPTVDV